MIDIDKETLQLITQVEEKLDLDLGSTEHISAEIFNIFFIDCLEPAVDEFPKIARDSLAIARDYYAGNSTAENVERSKNNCWKYLVKRKIAHDLEKKRNMPGKSGHGSHVFKAKTL